MAGYGSPTQQSVLPNETVIFTVTVVPSNTGFIRHADGTGTFNLRGWTPAIRGVRCPCANKTAKYFCDFGANIAVPTGGTVGEISLAITVDGAEVPMSRMRATPAAVEEFANISRAISVPIWSGCCQTVAVTNTSGQTITVDAPYITILEPDLM